MLSLRHLQALALPAAGAFLALTVTAGPTPAADVDDMVVNLGPVPAFEPILTKVGDERVIAFYLPDNGRCAVHAVVWFDAYSSAVPAKFWGNENEPQRFRIELRNGQIAHIDSRDNETLNLKCGANASNLAIVDSDEHMAFGTSPLKHVKASTTDF
jgi:hypothetical protein